jgi:mannose-6-phosphate isomerase-like protein (cupin superfamily)
MNLKRRSLLLASGCSVIGASLKAEGTHSAITKPLVVNADVDRWGRHFAPVGAAWTTLSSKDTGGAWSGFESLIAPKFGPPLHLHYNQEEWFRVLEGEFQFEVGGETYAVTRGMSILLPRRVPHRWQNTAASVGRLVIVLQPAGRMEEFFDALRALPPAERNDWQAVKDIYAAHQLEVLGPPLKSNA